MTGNTETQVAAPRRRVWPRLLLAASLTLNVLVLSVVVGAHLRDGRGGPDDRGIPPADRVLLRQGGFMPFFEAMPRDARARMAEALRERGTAPDRAELAADFRDFVAAVRAEPFEPDALDAVLEEQMARAEARVRKGREILVEQIAAMTPEERAAFADALERRFRTALTHAPGRPGSPPPPRN